MKKTLKHSGVPLKSEKIDYFEFVRSNPTKGIVISSEEARRRILETCAQKLKKAS